MVGAWLKANVAAVVLLVVAVGAGGAAVVVPSGDEGGGAREQRDFCDVVREVFAAGVDVGAPVANFISVAEQNGQLDTLISKAPDTATRDALDVLEQVEQGGQVDPAATEPAANQVASIVDSECGLALTVPTTTTAPATTAAPRTTAPRTTPPTTAPATTRATTPTTAPPTTSASPTT